MTTRRHYLAVGAVTLFGVSLIPLLWTYHWAKTNNSWSDLEHEEFIEAALISSAVLAALSLIAHVAANGRLASPLVIARGGTTGAVVAVATASAFTLLLAIVLEWKVGKGDVDSVVFALLSFVVLAISAGIGITTAWLLDDAPALPRTFGAAAIVLALSLLAGAYMADDATVLNLCVLDIELPLSTDYGPCSGY